MKLKRKLLNDTSGYTLIELMIILLIFAIAIVPIYGMVVSGAKIQKASEETYQATLQSQSILQSVKGQIEKDLSDQYKTKRKIAAVGAKKWLNPALGPTDLNKYLFNFLIEVENPTEVVDYTNPKVLELQNKFKTDTFLYEVHIWHIENGELRKIDPLDPLSAPKLPVSMFEYNPTITPPVANPTFTTTNTSDFTMVEINNAIKDYFGDKESLLWTNPASTTPGSNEPKAIGEITHKSGDEISITGNGMGTSVTSLAGSPDISVALITGYESIADVVDLSYERYKIDEADLNPDSEKTQNIIINGAGLTSADFIQLSVDLTTFIDPGTKVIRIENNTEAKVIIPVYNESNPQGIEIYPIQNKQGGNIVVENRQRREPSKNFVIGIIVRDAYNSTFGKPNKILSKIVDVYSYDYNNQ